jgi:hypothetical protein
MDRYSRQSRIAGPKTRWFQSQSCKRGDERAKHAAAKIISGVVGNSGTTMPISPNPAERAPAASQKGRISKVSVHGNRSLGIT